MDPLKYSKALRQSALKFSRERVPVSAIHPELQFTRLGAVLREHATEDNDVGHLARAALTSPHDQPLELMPLHALRDLMQEQPDHPLAGKFNWQELPEKVQMDQRAVELMKSVGAKYGTTLHPATVRQLRGTSRDAQAGSEVRDQLHKEFGASVDDVEASLLRHQLKNGREQWRQETEDTDLIHQNLANLDTAHHPYSQCERY